jgi:23S rRNA G2069 N7-methylase RlmK/C1962 C5-methylase RlmI
MAWVRGKVTPAERRDDLAEDRDAAAADRDTTSQERDADGRRRDADAAQRDIRAGQQGHGLNDGFEQLRRQILDHFAQIENTTIDPADWPDITPAALDRLRARAAEQRRLATLDRATAIRLLANLNDQISQLRVDRHDFAWRHRERTAGLPSAHAPCKR